MKIELEVNNLKEAGEKLANAAVAVARVLGRPITSDEAIYMWQEISGNRAKTEAIMMLLEALQKLSARAEIYKLLSEIEWEQRKPYSDYEELCSLWESLEEKAYLKKEECDRLIKEKGW